MKQENEKHPDALARSQMLGDMHRRVRQELQQEKEENQALRRAEQEMSSDLQVPKVAIQ